MTRGDCKKELIKNKRDFLFEEKKTIDENDGFAKVQGMIPFIETCKKVDEIFDYFEQKEAELRDECQKKISEINLEHDSMVCENCKYLNTSHEVFEMVCGIFNFPCCDGFGCTKFKRKQ